MARVRLATDLRSYAEGHSTLELDAPTLGDLFVALEKAYPAVGRRVTDERGRLRRHVNVFVGADRQVDLTTPLRPDDEVSILPAVTGG